MEWIDKLKHDSPGRFLTEERRRGSAVLIPLILTPRGTEILLEVRSWQLPAQPGEVCLPGGRMEPGETPEQTAVRETAEELAIDPEQVELVCSMDGIIGPGGRPVWPYLGILHDYADTWSADEVDHVFRVPLKFIMEDEPERFETELVTVPGEDFPFERIPGGRNYPWRHRSYDVLFYHWPDEMIWGLTARILNVLTERIRGGNTQWK